MLGVLDKSKQIQKNIWDILDKYRNCQHQLEPGRMRANQILKNISTNNVGCFGQN